jgi:methyl-accepting chemotaxis protein
VGTKLVHHAGATMNEIVDSIKHVTDIIGEITAASNEQTAGIEQVNDALMAMDAVTQQNAALVEQAATAAQSLQDQAATLEQVVGVFRLEDSATSASSASFVHAEAMPSPALASNGRRLMIG